MDNKTGVVKEKGYVIAIAIILELICVGSILLMLKVNMLFLILAIASGLIGLYIMLLYIDYSIKYDSEGFTYSNFLKKTTRHSYKDIVRITTEDPVWMIYVDGIKVGADFTFANRDIFFQIAKSEFANKADKKESIKFAELFLDNAKKIKGIKNIRLGHYEEVYALYFTERNIAIDGAICQKLTTLHDYYEKEKSNHRMFREDESHRSLLFAIFQLLGNNSESLLDDTLDLIAMYKKAVNKQGSLSEEEALSIASSIPKSDYEKFIAKSEDLSTEFKKKDLRFNGYELVGLSDKTTSKLSRDLIETKRILEDHPYFKPGRIIKNPAKNLTSVLALSNDAPSKICRDYFSIIDKLNQKGYDFGKGSCEESIGLFLLVDIDTEVLIQNFIEIDKFLEEVDAIYLPLHYSYSSILAVCYSMYSQGKDIEYKGYPLTSFVIGSIRFKEGMYTWLNDPPVPFDVASNANV